MNQWSHLRSWLRATFQRSRTEREMNAELHFHLETYAKDLTRSGIPLEEALRRARIEFGSLERAKEEPSRPRGGYLLGVRYRALFPDQRHRLERVGHFSLPRLASRRPHIHRSGDPAHRCGVCRHMGTGSSRHPRRSYGRASS